MSFASWGHDGSQFLLSGTFVMIRFYRCCDALMIFFTVYRSSQNHCIMIFSLSWAVYQSDVSLLHMWHWLFHSSLEGIDWLICVNPSPRLKHAALWRETWSSELWSVHYNPEIGGSEPTDKGEVSRQRFAQMTLSRSQSVGCVFPSVLIGTNTYHHLLNICFITEDNKQPAGIHPVPDTGLIPSPGHRAAQRCSNTHKPTNKQEHSCHMLALHCALCAVT